jgi:hypothetical protein
MSCQVESNRVAQFAGRLGAGLSQLSSKQAFFTGLAVGGASGTGLGAVVMANRQRIAGLFRGNSQPRQAVPVSDKSQPANGATRTKSKPKPIPALASGSPTKPKPKPIPGVPKSRMANSKPRPIPVLATPPTKLQAASIQVQTSGGKPFVAKNSYRVVRDDGADTGLAITPYLEQREGQNVPKKDAWSVTHAGSGALVDGPHDSLEQAQGLATKLSALPWTGSMSKTHIAQAKRIIRAYSQERS